MVWNLRYNIVSDLSKAGSPFASKKPITNDCLKDHFWQALLSDKD